MTGRKPRGLRPDEKQLWEVVKKSTVPLHQPAKKVLAEAIENIAAPAPRLDIPMFQIGQAASPAARHHVAMPPAPVQIDNKKLARMKKGKLTPEARIDLHGMTLAEAHPALIGFILSSHGNGRRLVLVITGKGRAKTGEGPILVQKGVLKYQVPTWLSHGPVGSIVQQVVDAHSSHGGGGALYVYLRKRR